MNNSLPNQKVSVIIPAYNAGLTILQTLGSVFSQTYSNLEIIVVNDGSTDNTLAILQELGSKIILISTENKGVSHARNTGLKHASGDFIQFLDADDLLHPEKIDIQLNALIANNAAVAYGNWQRFTEENGKMLYQEVESRTLKNDIEIDLFKDFWCPPAALLYTKNIVEKIGSWKEWLPIIQDARFMLDAAIHHGKFVYCPVLTSYYRSGQATSLSNKNALAFVKDVFTNTKDVWSIWQQERENLETKKEAIIQSLRYCIHEFSIHDKMLFEEAVNFLLAISPGYIPAQSGLLHILSRIFGYRTAEKIAAFKRKSWR